jgi:hypothetical protein
MCSVLVGVPRTSKLTDTGQQTPDCGNTQQIDKEQSGAGNQQGFRLDKFDRCSHNDLDWRIDERKGYLREQTRQSSS